MKKRKDYTRKIIICGYQNLLCIEPVKKLSKPILEFNKVLRYFKIIFFCFLVIIRKLDGGNQFIH